jgi:hypothetical protein
MTDNFLICEAENRGRRLLTSSPQLKTLSLYSKLNLNKKSHKSRIIALSGLLRNTIFLFHNWYSFTKIIFSFSSLQDGKTALFNVFASSAGRGPFTVFHNTVVIFLTIVGKREKLQDVHNSNEAFKHCSCHMYLFKDTTVRLRFGGLSQIKNAFKKKGGPFCIKSSKNVKKISIVNPTYSYVCI